MFTQKSTSKTHNRNSHSTLLRLALMASLLAGLTFVSPTALVKAAVALGLSPAGYNLNGDSYADLVVGVPYEDIGSGITGVDAGAALELHGASGGLTSAGNFSWDRADPGMGTIDIDELFGYAVASADFNRDGYADLAVGVPGQDIEIPILGEQGSAGAVHILYGGPASLSTVGSAVWHLGNIGNPGIGPWENDHFGRALAAGDFDGDGYADLAIGVPGLSWGGGAVQILYGSPGGLNATRVQFWHQNIGGVEGSLEADDGFGSSLASGDFNDDGYDDLAIGVPGEDLDGKSDVGAVHVLFGHANEGLSAASSQFWYQGPARALNDSAEAGDKFGWSLAAGDFGGAGNYDDLAIGVLNETVNASKEGAVHVLYGSVSGLSSAFDVLLYQDIAGTLPVSEAEDYFGYALAAGDLNGDGHADLAIGVPYQDWGATENTGAVCVLYGSAGGITTTGAQSWDQNILWVADDAEEGDRFGWALAIGDLSGDGYADLAIGVPYEDVGSVVDAGAVSVLYGSAAGLASSGNQFWHQNTPGVDGVCEANDHFGYALAIADWNSPVYFIHLPLSFK
ncbi:MAG: hypothetical protein AB1894_00875 [Chloroflexota bacterium]